MDYSSNIEFTLLKGTEQEVENDRYEKTKSSHKIATKLRGLENYPELK